MWEIRTITAAEEELFRARTSLAFGRDPDTGESAVERFRAIFEKDRTFAAFDGDDIIGTVTGFSLEVTVPGGAQVPVGGTTAISVKPTHRRRGVLRAMLERHLDDVAGRGEPLAGLWSSEGSLYARFGYGPATFRYVMETVGPSLDFGDVSAGDITLRIVEPGKAGPVVRDVYERFRPGTVGALRRSDAWWEHRVLADRESWRGGKSAQRYLVAEREGTAVGYAIYRQKSKWDDFVAGGELTVEELITLDHLARQEMWRFFANVHLFPDLDYWNLALDDPLPHLVADQRRVRRHVADALWVRLMDVPAALGARAYESDGVVSFAVSDPTRSEVEQGYRLQVGEGRGQCEPFSGEVELRFGADVLGHLYLGGGSAVSMAAAGRIHGALDAVETLDRILRTTRPPWCPEVF